LKQKQDSLKNVFEHRRVFFDGAQTEKHTL